LGPVVELASGEGPSRQLRLVGFSIFQQPGSGRSRPASSGQVGARGPQSRGPPARPVPPDVAGRRPRS